MNPWVQTIRKGVCLFIILQRDLLNANAENDCCYRMSCLMMRNLYY